MSEPGSAKRTDVDSPVNREDDSAVVRKADSADTRQAESAVGNQADSAGSAADKVTDGRDSCAAHTTVDSEGGCRGTHDSLTHNNAAAAFSSNGGTKAESDGSTATDQERSDSPAVMPHSSAHSHAAVSTRLSSIESTGAAAFPSTDICASVQNTPAARSFQPADNFGGAKAGFVFKLAERGLGYYADSQHASSAEHAVPVEAARPHAYTDELLPNKIDCNPASSPVQASGMLEGNHKDSAGVHAGVIQSDEPREGVMNTDALHYWGQALQYLDCSVQVSTTSS